MKTQALLSLFILITPLAAQSGSGSSTPAPTAGERVLQPHQKAFLNLPEESRKEFVKNLSEAHRVFQQKRIFESLEAVRKAAEIFPDSPEVYNLRGSCYVEMRSFDKALAEFRKASELTGENPSVEFNVGEVYFVTKEWKKSLDVFEKVMEMLPDKDAPLGRLTEFKILLCKLKLGQDDEVRKLAEKYDYLDDSPYYYYAMAALAYDAEKPTEAAQWLARAKRIFRREGELAPWQDTIVEYGYIKSFYGGSDEAAE